MFSFLLKKTPKKIQEFYELLSTSYKDILKLSSGTASSQIIAALTMPIITRLYGPESFGVLGIFH